ncbi:MAG: hypothetical protein HQL82_08375 [Magnetococcales bacterium]|nr:hypothetical protein [Magnetococcales bacterium]
MTPASSTVAGDPPDAIPLGPEGNVVLDPAILGSGEFSWPTAPSAQYHFRLELLDGMGRMLLVDRTAGTRALFARKRINLLLATRLYFRHVVRQLEREPRPGLRVRPAGDNWRAAGDQLFVSRWDRTPGWKKRLVRNAQVGMLWLGDRLGVPRPLIQVQNLVPPPALAGRRRYRLRAPYGFLNQPGRLTVTDEAEIQAVIDHFWSLLLERAAANGIAVEAGEREVALSLVGDLLRSACLDHDYLRRILDGRPLDLLAGSVGGYFTSLLAMATFENGGQVYAATHGAFHFGDRNPADLQEFINTTHFYCPTRGLATRGAAALEAHFGSLRPPCRVEFLAERKDPPMPPEPALAGPVRAVMVMGGHYMPDIQVAGVVLPVMLDLELRLCDFLQRHGYRVILKPHPESSWKGQAALVAPGVQVEWRPFEQVWRQADAFIFPFLNTTPAYTAFATNRPLIYLWYSAHDVWSSEVLEMIAARCELVKTTTDDRNRLVFNEDTLLEILARPKPVDPGLWHDLYG